PFSPSPPPTQHCVTCFSCWRTSSSPPAVCDVALSVTAWQTGSAALIWVETPERLRGGGGDRKTAACCPLASFSSSVQFPGKGKDEPIWREDEAFPPPPELDSPEHYEHHWFPEKPSKGSGYRCIRINHKMDPIITKVASQIGLSQPQLHQLLPSELTLWVDPYEVSYRIGENGSICILYEKAPVAASYGLLTCKNQMMLGRSSPSKNYIMAVSS
uniref:BTG anti-proliferation factor 2 n=1 Tax=Equus caballus TaxID=9796 RepID=A0A9L0S3F6_HORSE